MSGPRHRLPQKSHSTGLADGHGFLLPYIQALDGVSAVAQRLAWRFCKISSWY